MLMTILIIMAIIAASGFVGLGVSFIGHKLRLEDDDGQRKRATFHATQAACWPGVSPVRVNERIRKEFR
jgi:hypothetical protein